MPRQTAVSQSMDKIGVINGLRGFAIVWVIYYHISEHIHLTQSGWLASEVFGVKVFPYTFLSNGRIGVYLFFVLSGFVLYLPYAMGKRRMESKEDALGFYKRRASRLLPLYYIFFLIMFVFTYFVYGIRTNPEFFRYVFLMLTVTFNFTVDMFSPKYNTDLWSIGVEVWFSLLFPLFILLARRAGVARAFIFTAVAAFLVRWGLLNRLFYSFTHDAAVQLFLDRLKIGLPGHMDDFVLGMLICHLYVNRESARMRVYPLLYAAAGLFFLLIGCNLLDYQTLNIPVPFDYTPYIANLLQAGFFLLIISALSFKGRPLKAVVSNRPVQVLGMMSYSLYVWHHHVIISVIGMSDAYIAEHAVSAVAIAVVTVLALSALSYRYIEFGNKDVREIFLLKKA